MRGAQNRRPMPTTGRLFVVSTLWRELYEPGSPLPSAGPLREADTEGTPDGDVALVYCGRVEYVGRDYVEEITNA